MIKLKELLNETSISMGQVHSNPYVHSFKSLEEIESVTEASTSVDLTIQRSLEKDLKSAGIKVKSFKKDISVMGKRAPNSKTIVWGGVFKTKNATIPISVASEGSVFYQDRHIGVLNKGSKVKDNFRSLKVSNKWVESVNEAYGDLNDNGFKKVEKYNKIAIKLVKKIENAVRHSEGKDAVKWIRGLYDAVGIMYDTIGHKMYYESINEKVARPMSYRLRKAQDEIEYMIKQGPLDDEGVYDKPGQAMKLLQTAQKALGKIK
jgi:hypothetical protein